LNVQSKNEKKRDIKRLKANNPPQKPKMLDYTILTDFSLLPFQEKPFSLFPV
jgi:hypothetical protein